MPLPEALQVAAGEADHSKAEIGEERQRHSRSRWRGRRPSSLSPQARSVPRWPPWSTMIRSDRLLSAAGRGTHPDIARDIEKN
jgi:hypothetical protein